MTIRWITAAAALAFGAGLMASATPAKAQIPTILPVKVKVGGYMPEGSKLGFDAEVDVTLPTPGLGSTVLTAGYAQSSEDGVTLRVIPVTVSRVFSPPNPAAGITGNVYFGAGVGAYFLRASGNGDSESKTSLGGFGVVGYQFPNAYSIEAKYHVTGKVRDISPNGVSVLIGRRF